MKIRQYAKRGIYVLAILLLGNYHQNYVKMLNFCFPIYRFFFMIVNSNKIWQKYFIDSEEHMFHNKISKSFTNKTKDRPEKEDMKMAYAIDLFCGAGE